MDSEEKRQRWECRSCLALVHSNEKPIRCVSGCKKPLYVLCSVEDSEENLTTEERKEITRIIADVIDKKSLVKKIIERQPIYYDEGRSWWLWDLKTSCWILTDEINLLNIIDDLSTANTIHPREKTELLEALKQVGRRNKPKDIKKTWIQFKHEIYDVETGKQFKATPEYFATNPIPYALSKDKFMETPTMEKIFKEWVGKDHVKHLYEWIAYCMLPDYPMARILILTGGGSNGKTCFLNLMRKFIGAKNCIATDLDLLLSSRFEATKLYKKLMCQMGETNFNQMNKTSPLKRLTGQDLIGFEYKHKTPFDAFNYAKLIIATNNIPETTDKSDGFYRRMDIIDFPNKFSEKIDILATIPEEEYEYLALKCCYLLGDLLKERSFTNEPSIEERRERYEAKSNPIANFIKENCLTGDEGSHVWNFEFCERLNTWCSENRQRQFSSRSVNLKLKELGFESGKKYNNDLPPKQWRCFYGLKWRKQQDA